MQSSKELVSNAIHFRNPERLPVEFSAMGISDTAVVNWNQTGAGNRDINTTFDEWNCEWSRTEVKNMGLVTGHPLLSWDKLSTFKWPDPDNNLFYEGMENKFKDTDGKYVKTEIFMLLFERIHSLRGFENTLTDLYLEKEKISHLADRIVEFDIRIIENISKRFPNKINGLFFTDDWGTELNSFISVELWDEFFKPRYKKIFSAAKAAGWDVWMHSCGKINNLIPSLIEIGCNVLNMQQPLTNGINEIGKKFAGKICFSSLCDIQHTLPFKSNEEIEAEAKELLTKWGTKNGGFILSDYGDDRAIGVNGTNKKQIMYNAFMKYDRWKTNV
ncbi:MAG: uroporphyrinogen decarboxylase family protein [Elusimicrobia bacterium]|nr:uroporphyrinogen decarboxylase family protein [Elusimicrobiota bacterium]